MLPVLPRQLEVDTMINGKFYFILHAPRQSGKTTYLKALTEQINLKGEFYALNCTLENCTGNKDESTVMTRIVAEINRALKMSSVPNLSVFASSPEPLLLDDPSVLVTIFLNHLCSRLDKDLIVFFDAVDCLTDQPLSSFLHQIRIGYNYRTDSPKSKFPRSMALVGIRDIKDYLVRVHPESECEGIASPFNIKKKALTLANFTQTEIGTLYRQHTEASGQLFEDSAIERAWHWSEGQPWLVNALAYEAVVEILKDDYSKAVTAEIIDKAAREIILSRPVHLDSLLERIKEPRLNRALASVIFGSQDEDDEVSDEDINYIQDLELIKYKNSSYTSSNPIYEEIILRKLASYLQFKVPKKLIGCWTDGQKLEITGLLKVFQQHWRENA
jgi:hypothetical protein